MPRTPLAQAVRDAALMAAAARRGCPTGEAAAERQGGRLTRRQLLQGSAAAGVLSLGVRNAAARPAGTPRIVVVGAGLAGLTCAYRLKQAGCGASVYEAATRVGGRCWTGRGIFADGQLYERGGELIDQGHTQLRQLIQELGLTADNLLRAERNGTEPVYYFDGQPYTFAQATDDLKAVWQKLHRDLSEASYPTLYNQFTERGAELDQLSVSDWIAESVPGGTASRLGQLLDVAYNIEYGAESSEQSALNLIYLLGYAGPGQFRVFGKSDEKYRVRGGNDQVPTRLAQLLPGQITLGWALVAVRLNASGSYTLSFQTGGETKEVVADQVVLALPFSILRAQVDLHRSGFSPLKRTAIEELGMATNSKLHLQFRRRHWESLGYTGETYADTGYQNTWEVTRAQPGTAGILVDYTGGQVGASFGSGTPTARAQQFLAQIEPVLPGLSAQWNGLATIDFWAGYPWTLGSYSYWKVGQYTRFAGVERQQEGNCHFAGEHTSVDFQGYLNGAVESGERAAAEVLDDLAG
jgi:monoamine oxidase